MWIPLFTSFLISKVFIPATDLQPEFDCKIETYTTVNEYLK